LKVDAIDLRCGSICPAMSVCVLGDRPVAANWAHTAFMSPWANPRPTVLRKSGGWGGARTVIASAIKAWKSA